MAFSAACNTKYQKKSISLPSRSNPTTFLIEEELNKLKSMAATKLSPENLCSGLSQLSKLYKSIDHLLNSSTTHNLISRHHSEKWVNELIDESMKFLDICSSTREIVSQMAEHCRDLQCAIRRRKGDLSTENTIEKYNCFRKKMRKGVKGLLSRLKQVGTGGSPAVDSDPELRSVNRVMIEVSEMTFSVFESVLTFFSAPSSKQNKWSIVVSKLIHKGMVTREDEQKGWRMSDLKNIDDLLLNLCKYDKEEEERIKICKCRLEKMEDQFEEMESGLECMFRCLIGTRASLLNIISH